MNVILFSDSEQMKERFLPLARSRAVDFSLLPCSSLKSGLKEAPREAFAYVDVSGYERESRERILKYLKIYGKHRYGIVDPEGSVRDIGTLFLNGASDYVGSSFDGQITPRRVYSALALRAHLLEDTGSHKKTLAGDGHILSGSDWRKIRSGQEYTFCLMYIELEDKRQLRRTLSDDLIGMADTSFRSYVERTVSQNNGKVWMWNDFEGIVLFPFDGKRCEAVLMCFGLMLSRTIYSVENPHFNNLLSFSICLHLGNTVYRRSGETGTIVSDSVNTVFNIGRKFGESGNFYLTGEVLAKAPKGIEKCFLPAGRFEGFEVLRMRLPI
jgi:hypothetical protein